MLVIENPFLADVTGDNYVLTYRVGGSLDDLFDGAGHTLWWFDNKEIGVRIIHPWRPISSPY